jgi:hypothetical protein
VSLKNGQIKFGNFDNLEFLLYNSVWIIVFTTYQRQQAVVYN